MLHASSVVWGRLIFSIKQAKIDHCRSETLTCTSTTLGITDYLVRIYPPRQSWPGTRSAPANGWNIRTIFLFFPGSFIGQLSRSKHQTTLLAKPSSTFRGSRCETSKLEPKTLILPRGCRFSSQINNLCGLTFEPYQLDIKFQWTA